MNQVRPDVPAELAAVVARMLAKEPAQRFQTPIEVAEVLAPFCKAGQKPGAQPEEKVPQGSSAPGRTLPVASSRIAPIKRPVSGVPASNSPSTVDTSPFAELDAAAPPPEKGTPRTPHPKAKKKGLILGGAVASLLLLGLLALWASGVFKVKTKDGTIVLEGLPDDAEVVVDGAKVAIQQAGESKPIEISVAPGKRKLVIKRAGFKIETQETTVSAGERKPITVRLEPLAVAPDRPPLSAPWQRRMVLYRCSTART